MLDRIDPRTWPISLKVPLAVAGLMILVGLLLSQQVLTSLTQNQERHLRGLAQSYLDGLSSSIAPSILREDTWEIYDAIERATDLNKGLRPLETIVINAEGQVLAASDPRRHPIGSTLSTRQQALASPDDVFSFAAGADTASAARKLSYPGRTVGLIHAVFDTRHLAAERRAVILALIATNGAVTLVLAIAGWLLVTRMMYPVRILADHLGQARETSAVAIPELIVARQRGEFRRLFQAYNNLVQGVQEREVLLTRLAEEERLGSLGRLASALAHEINNPLGGLFNALATLKSHHGGLANVRANAIGLLERGLFGIRDVVRTTLAVYRTEVSPRSLTAADIGDLELLISPEARRKAVKLCVINKLADTVELPSTPVRQAILNLMLNAVSAAPAGSQVSLSAHTSDNALIVTVVDRGPGLPEEAAETLVGSVTAPPLHSGGGLGLWTTQRLVTDLGGTISIARPAEGGTAVNLKLPIARPEEFPHVA